MYEVKIVCKRGSAGKSPICHRSEIMPIRLTLAMGPSTPNIISNSHFMFQRISYIGKEGRMKIHIVDRTSTL